MVTLKIVRGLEKVPEAADIRREVFVEEQGFQREFDDIDAAAYHVLATNADGAVGTARAYPKGDGVYAIGRVAVRKPYRGKGVGAILIRALEDRLRQDGAASVELSAQLAARGFYEKLGYVAFGDEHLDEFCPHIMMRHAL